MTRTGCAAQIIFVAMISGHCNDGADGIHDLVDTLGGHPNDEEIPEKQFSAEEVCLAYIECIAETLPSGLAATIAGFGEDGTCWKTLSPDECRESCIVGLKGSHEAFPDAVNCPECLQSEDCTSKPEARACETKSGECVQCAKDSHCFAPTPACNINTHICVECTQDDHCPGSRPACDEEKNSCVQCTRNNHCPDDLPVCIASHKQCVECENDSHCDGDSSGCAKYECCSPHVCDEGQCGPKTDSCGRSYSCGPCPCDDGWRDPSTGLCWQVKGIFSEVSNEAIEKDTHYCPSLGAGWRVPSISELRTLVSGCYSAQWDLQWKSAPNGVCGISKSCPWSLLCWSDACENGCTNAGGSGIGGCYWKDPMNTAACGYYWSSTSSGTGDGINWGVNFKNGQIFTYGFSGRGSLRCVRESSP